MQEIEIIYEDHDLIVCHKMPGIPVQTAKLGAPDMVSLLRNYFAGKGEADTGIFVVHRLDQPVEGVMVFARSKAAAAGLSRQSREKHMDKFYLALAEGEFEQPAGVLEHFLLHEKRSNISRVVQRGTPGAKRSELRYEVEAVFSCRETGSNYLAAQVSAIDQADQMDRTVSLVRIQLETGRHHQIRVQMAETGHPLVGDRKYNPRCVSGYLPIGLCAVKIAFMHPVTGAPMEFQVQPKGGAFGKYMQA